MGSANVTLYYTVDNSDHSTLPDKTEAEELSEMISEGKEKLILLKERQTLLADLEQDILRQNSKVDDRLVITTIIESVGILLLAILETLVLRRFIAKKEMF